MDEVRFCAACVLIMALHVTAFAQEGGGADLEAGGTPTSFAMQLTAPSGGGEDVSDSAPAADPAEFIDFSIRPRSLGPRPRPGAAVFSEFGLAVLGFGAGTGITMGLLVVSAVVGFYRAFLVISVAGAFITFGLTDAALYNAGLATGGRGSAGWTTLGMFLGAGAGALIGYGLIRGAERPGHGASGTAQIAGMALMPLFGIAGGILAFELSDRAARRRSAQALSVVPVAGPIEGGLSLGLVGRF